MKESKQTEQQRPQEARPKRLAQEFVKKEIPSDVLGSYTGQGTYEDPPVQDADDL